jgi:hypothetical protein
LSIWLLLVGVEAVEMVVAVVEQGDLEREQG